MASPMLSFVRSAIATDVPKRSPFCWLLIVTSGDAPVVSPLPPVFAKNTRAAPLLTPFVGAPTITSRYASEFSFPTAIAAPNCHAEPPHPLDGAVTVAFGKRLPDPEARLTPL